MHTSHARGVTDQMLTRWRLPYLTAMPEKISEIPASATPTATRHSLRIAKAIMTPWPTLLAASLTPHIVRGALPRLNAQLAAPTLGRPPAHSASHHHTVHGRPPLQRRTDLVLDLDPPPFSTPRRNPLRPGNRAPWPVPLSPPIEQPLSPPIEHQYCAGDSRRRSVVIKAGPNQSGRAWRGGIAS